MKAELIVGIIGVIVSLIISIYSSWRTLVNQRKLSLLKQDLEEKSHERNARRDYEYEARKNLYAEYEPLKFQLLELSKLATGRIKGLSISLRNGTIDKSIWSDVHNFYFKETIYKLFAPLAVFKLMKEKLTVVDIRLDQDIYSLYTLLNTIYYSFQEEYKIARIRQTEDDRKYLKQWELYYISPDHEKFNRQGIPSFEIDKLVEEFISNEGGEKRLVEFWEFEVKLSKSNKFEFISPAINLLSDFKIEEKPILWTLFISHACIYDMIYKIGYQNQSDEEKLNLVQLVEGFFDEWKDYFIYSETFEEEYKISETAKAFVLKKINKGEYK